MQEKPLKTWFHEARHIEKISGEPQGQQDHEEWRKIKERMKTVSVALVLCLNVGVDPPDTIKPVPCARREAWVEPSLMNITKVPQQVATNLQKSYERLQPRARYKAAIDPTIDYIKRLCISLRKSAGKERVLFHFNGHGVPKPTEAGEIWVFNKNITQYIPVSIYDLQAWMGTPSVYVWDCHSAGTIVKNFKRFALDHNVTWMREANDPKNELHNKEPPNFNECIQLAACDENELLPTDPDLPADLFSSCLTTPIQTSMLWYVLKTNNKDRYSLQMIDSIPGTLNERRSVLGELNWIFTAITDTIAWNRLPRDTFQRLFRQDLLVASLFRSFLLAEKIMRDHGCRVVSSPVLPPVYDHPLWDYWEYTIELCLINMYNQKHKPASALHFSHNDCFRETTLYHSLLIEFHGHPQSYFDDFSYNWFFIEQLKAFEVWLKFDATREHPPDQLPVVLQVLLSQVHRVQALELLAKFVDIGSWAVLEALFVGVFPYVLKLLQSGTKELRNSLAFIWAKILIVDAKCCDDLLNDDGFMYFIDILRDRTVQPRYKIVPAFVICTLMNHHGR
jgi:regulator-associated protein of mTOR